MIGYFEFKMRSVCILNVGVEGALRIEKIPEEVPIEAARLLSLLLYYCCCCYCWSRMDIEQPRN